MIHELKTLPEYFSAVKKGLKKFEIRKNDRNFKVGDTLILLEFDFEKGYTGEKYSVNVLYILSDLRYIPKGYVCMSISPINLAQWLQIQLKSLKAKHIFWNSVIGFYT